MYITLYAFERALTRRSAIDFTVFAYAVPRNVKRHIIGFTERKASGKCK